MVLPWTKKQSDLNFLFTPPFIEIQIASGHERKQLPLIYMVFVAQLAERRIVIPGVEGSIPSNHPKYAEIAQLEVACDSYSQGR